MKHIITTTPFLEFAIAHIGGKDEEIIILGKSTDTVPLHILEVVTEVTGTKIRVIISETKEENLLWLGSILCNKTEGDEFVIIGDSITLSDNIKKIYGIKTEKVKKEPVKPRVRNLKKQSKQSDGKEEKPAVKVRRESVKANEKEEAANASAAPKKKAETEVNVQQNEVKAEVKTENETGSGKSDRDEFVQKFIKGMSVRGSDLQDCVLTDEELAEKLAEIIGRLDDVGEIKEEIEGIFADDAKVIWNWIKPNIRNLKTLADEMKNC